MEAALRALQKDVLTCKVLENSLRGKPLAADKKARASRTTHKDPELGAIRDVDEILESCLAACRETRKRHRDEAEPPDDASDAAISQYVRFTDEIKLDVYQEFLHYVPRLVNVVRGPAATACDYARSQPFVPTHQACPRNPSPLPLPPPLHRSRFAYASPVSYWLFNSNRPNLLPTSSAVCSAKRPNITHEMGSSSIVRPSTSTDQLTVGPAMPRALSAVGRSNTYDGLGYHLTVELACHRGALQGQLLRASAVCGKQPASPLTSRTRAARVVLRRRLRISQAVQLAYSNPRCRVLVFRAHPMLQRACASLRQSPRPAALRTHNSLTGCAFGVCRHRQARRHRRVNRRRCTRSPRHPHAADLEARAAQERKGQTPHAWRSHVRSCNSPKKQMCICMFATSR